LPKAVARDATRNERCLKEAEHAIQPSRHHRGGTREPFSLRTQRGPANESADAHDPHPCDRDRQLRSRSSGRLSPARIMSIMDRLSKNSRSLRKVERPRFTSARRNTRKRGYRRPCECPPWRREYSMRLARLTGAAGGRFGGRGRHVEPDPPGGGSVR
jgi:hypothetical protein